MLARIDASMTVGKARFNVESNVVRQIVYHCVPNKASGVGPSRTLFQE
jgi:hypothetical protein